MRSPLGGQQGRSGAPYGDCGLVLCHLCWAHHLPLTFCPSLPLPTLKPGNSCFSFPFLTQLLARLLHPSHPRLGTPHQEQVWHCRRDSWWHRDRSIHTGIVRDDSFHGERGKPNQPQFIQPLCQPLLWGMGCPTCTQAGCTVPSLSLPMLCASSGRVRDDVQGRYSSTGNCFPRPPLGLLKTGPLVRKDSAMGKDLIQCSRTTC